ncbi:MAG: ROK family protein [Anaerolineae bacterium]
MSILSIDFGGTRTRAAWYTADYAQLARSEMRSHVEQSMEQVIERIIELGRKVVPQGATVRAIGITAPGPLDTRAGVIRHAKTLPGWRDVPLCKLLSEAFGGAPAFIENDANLAALAEYHRGAARGCDPALYLTISTGIGGGLVSHGQLFAGWSGLAIEPGHMRFTLPDGTVKRWEELASGVALGWTAERYLAASDQPSSLRALAEVDGQAVGEAGQAGDRLALSVIEETGRWLGLGLTNLLHLFSPQVIVLGGSVSKLGELILGPARATIHEHILDEQFIPPDLLRAAYYGEDVCLIGAALHAGSRIAGGNRED